MSNPNDYKPHGGAAELFYSSKKELLFDGPRGTGKTRGVLEKFFALCYLWPRSRWGLIRKRRTDLSESVLNTFEELVVPPGHSCLEGASGKRPTRGGRTVYKVGDSEILALGLDDPNKFRSMELTGAAIFEVTQATEEDWELVLSSLRWPHGEYHQLIGDTNPRGRREWAIRRANDPGTKMGRIKSRHKDNPRYWNHELDEPTPEGLDYVFGENSTLETLTGVRRSWYLVGDWRDSEGVIFEEWDEDVHVIDRFDIPSDWTRVESTDFGYEHALVTLSAAVDPDGTVYIYRELHETHRLVEDVARETLAFRDDERRVVGPIRTRLPMVCDHDREDRATFERHGVVTYPANKDVDAGIQTVKSYLRVRPNGKARVYYFRDALVHRDARLHEAGKPTDLPDEMGTYAWDKKRDGAAKDVPLKVDDDACDALRYLLHTLETDPSFGVIQGAVIG